MVCKMVYSSHIEIRSPRNYIIKEARTIFMEKLNMTIYVCVLGVPSSDFFNLLVIFMCLGYRKNSEICCYLSVI